MFFKIFDLSFSSDFENTSNDFPKTNKRGEKKTCTIAENKANIREGSATHFGHMHEPRMTTI